MSGIDIEARLRDHAEFLLSDARESLEESGEVWPKAHIFGADGRVAVCLIDPGMMVNGAEKSALAAKIKAIAAEADAVGIVFMSDIWETRISPEQEAKRRAVEQMLGTRLGIPELAASGLCVKTEAVMVVMQIKGAGKTLIKIPYQRSGGRGGRKTIVWGDRTEETGGEFSGRFMEWF